MLASLLPPSFLDTYSLSTLSLGCNAFCMVISILVLWSICLSSSLVHFVTIIIIIIVVVVVVYTLRVFFLPVLTGSFSLKSRRHCRWFYHKDSLELILLNECIGKMILQ